MRWNFSGTGTPVRSQDVDCTSFDADGELG